MQSISLDEIQPGMYLSKPLISSDGTVLLHEGVEIKERYIRYLRNKGIETLFVGYPELVVDESESEDFNTPQQRKETMDTAREIVKQFRVGKGINLSRVQNMVTNFINQLEQNPEIMIHLLDIRRKEAYMFSHAVNTCILSVMTGLALGYDQQQLRELGLAAMLHDVGKTKFTRYVAQQFPPFLTKYERDEYKRHCYYSLEILRENNVLSNEVTNAVFQHHERWNGSGYPMGLRGDNICEYAQIISIADVYDRLIAGVPYRKPTPVYFAVAILNQAAGEYFNPAIVDIFTQNVAVYPMGKMVRLSNNQSGLILGVGINSKTTPVVRIVSSQDSSTMNQLVELDLKRNPGLFIIDFEELTPTFAQVYNNHIQRPKEWQIQPGSFLS